MALSKFSSKPEKYIPKMCMNFFLKKCEYGFDCPNLHPIGIIPKVCLKYFKNTFCEDGKDCNFLHLSSKLNLFPCFQFIKYGICSKCCHKHRNGLNYEDEKNCFDCRCHYAHFKFREIDVFKILGVITTKYWAPDFRKMCGIILKNPFFDELQSLFVEKELIRILYEMYYGYDVMPDKNISKECIPKREEHCFKEWLKGIFVEKELLNILYLMHSDKYVFPSYYFGEKDVLNAHIRSVKAPVPVPRRCDCCHCS